MAYEDRRLCSAGAYRPKCRWLHICQTGWMPLRCRRQCSRQEPRRVNGKRVLPPLDLAEALKHRVTMAGTARRNSFGEWYLPPTEWNTVHTARTWAELHKVERPMLNAMIERGRNKSKASGESSHLKTLERELQRKIKSEGYVVAAFKEFTKSHGYRQPRFLQRIKTPSNAALENTRKSIQYAATHAIPLSQGTSLPELAEFLTIESCQRMSKHLAW